MWILTLGCDFRGYSGHEIVRSFEWIEVECNLVCYPDILITCKWLWTQRQAILTEMFCSFPLITEANATLVHQIRSVWMAQGQSGRVQKNLTPTGIWFLNQPVCSESVSHVLSWPMLPSTSFLIYCFVIS